MSVAVSFVIVNWNGRHLLEDCLRSIRAQTFTDFEVLLVDNGSTDGSIEYVRAQFPEVRILSLPENQGFAGPNNLAFREASGEFIATVNNDLSLDPAWLQHLVAVLRNEPSCFSMQGKILRADKPEIVDTCGLGMRPCGAARNLAHNRAAESLQEQREIFAVSAGAALYRKQMLQDLGLFDESYFAYYEDLDLGWRARKKGWKSLFVPQALSYHKVHGTSKKVGSDFLWFLSERNRLRTVYKNLPFSVLLRHPLKLALDEARYIDMIRKNLRWRTLVRARITVLVEILGLRIRRTRSRSETLRDWNSWTAM